MATIDLTGDDPKDLSLLPELPGLNKIIVNKGQIDTSKIPPAIQEKININK